MVRQSNGGEFASCAKMVLPAAAALFGSNGGQPGCTHCAARFPRSDREKRTRSAATVPYHQLPRLNMVVRCRAVRCDVTNQMMKESSMWFSGWLFSLHFTRGVVSCHLRFVMCAVA